MIYFDIIYLDVGISVDMHSCKACDATADETRITNCKYTFLVWKRHIYPHIKGYTLLMDRDMYIYFGCGSVRGTVFISRSTIVCCIKIRFVAEACIFIFCQDFCSSQD